MDLNSRIDDIELNKIHSGNAGRIGAMIAFFSMVLYTLSYDSFLAVDFWIAVAFAGLMYFVVYAAVYVLLNLLSIPPRDEVLQVLDIPPDSEPVDPGHEMVEQTQRHTAQMKRQMPAGLKFENWQAVHDAISRRQFGTDRETSYRDMHKIGVSRYDAIGPGGESSAVTMIGFLKSIGVLDDMGFISDTPLPPVDSVTERRASGGVSTATTTATAHHHPTTA